MTAPWAAPGSAAPTVPPAVVPVGTVATPDAARPSAGPGSAVARGDATAPRRPPVGELEGNPLANPAPGGPGVVLDDAFGLLRFRFGRLVGVAASVLLPVQLVGLLLAVWTGLRPEGGTAQVTSNSAAVALVAATTWVEVLVVALRGMALGAVGLCAGHLAASWMDGRDPTYREVMAFLVRRSWVVPVVTVLGWCVKAPFLLLGGLGFFLGDALVFTAAAVAGAERLGPWSALRRSVRLGRAAFGVALVVCLGGALITQVMQVALLLGPAALVSVLGLPDGWLLALQQAGSLVLLVTVPLTACIAARAWVELSCRAEGLDLRRRAVRRGWAGPA